MIHSVACMRSLAMGFLSLALLLPTSSIGGTEPAGPMSTARERHIAVGLADGRALIAGGYTAQGLASSAEIYDPASGSFSPTGSLAEARWGVK